MASQPDYEAFSDAPRALIPAITAPRVQLDVKKLAVIKATIAPTLTNTELAFFGHVCQRMQLDPFARQIYAIKRGDKLTIQVGIDGFRALAERTGLYRGQIGPLWCGPDGEWVKAWLSDEPPVAAKVGVLRADFTRPMFAVARTKAYRVDNNGLWKTMPEVMIAKCAEALALRKAFPDALSGAYEPQEMDQADARPPVVDEAEYQAARVVEAQPTIHPAPKPAPDAKNPSPKGGTGKPVATPNAFESLHLRAVKAWAAQGHTLTIEEWEDTCQEYGGAVKPEQMSPEGKRTLKAHVEQIEREYDPQTTDLAALATGTRPN